MTQEIKTPTELLFTKHAEKRMKQRSLSAASAHLVYWYGTQISENEIVFRNKDAIDLLKDIGVRSPQNHCQKTQQSEMAFLWSPQHSRLKNQQDIESLIGWKLVISGQRIISCYRITKSSQKKYLTRKLH